MFVGLGIWTVFRCVFLGDLYGLVIISLRKREPVAFL